MTLAVAVWASSSPSAVRAISGPQLGDNEQLGYDDTPNWLATEYLGERFVGPKRAARDLEGVLGYAVVGGLALLIGLCVWMGIRQLLHRPGREPLAAADAALDLDLEELARAVATGTDDRLAALSAGTPAEGVIAAWTHLEAAVHAAGVPLGASRTSSEVTVEVLRHFEVDDETLHGLAALYREARWSRHPLDESARTRAAAAYRSLDDAVRAAAPTPRGRARG
ncbi:DUF4129 domain-containing protein [Oryzobacter terrae]|uniref:DUF4129 domain-containing protein n=1 Tax=Oryzobacter terrae TaxID=1620385 RepID=UPI00366FD1A2